MNQKQALLLNLILLLDPLSQSELSFNLIFLLFKDLDSDLSSAMSAKINVFMTSKISQWLQDKLS